MKMSKTFTTRKGALLLFSEDYACKYDTDEEEGREGELGRRSLYTFGDLAKSILTYGNHVSKHKCDVVCLTMRALNLFHVISIDWCSIYLAK